MPSWNPQQYLKFEQERTRPCADLAARIALGNVRRVIDLGCGPGNSTRVLAERWPEAEITGLDSSAKMIAAARANAHNTTRPAPGAKQLWLQADIADWAAGKSSEEEKVQKFDVVFSNAALQWLPDHASLLPELLARVTEGGALAFQMPCRIGQAAHLVAREIAARPEWRNTLAREKVHDWDSKDACFYYDLLALLAKRVEMWQTEYFHLLKDARAIVEWYTGTGLRSYLDSISDPGGREKFLEQYLEGIRVHYPPRTDGRVLLPFLRLFLIAYR